MRLLATVLLLATLASSPAAAQKTDVGTCRHATLCLIVMVDEAARNRFITQAEQRVTIEVLESRLDHADSVERQDWEDPQTRWTSETIVNECAVKSPGFVRKLSELLGDLGQQCVWDYW
ncbi:MAG: hypothetical protein OXO52_22035 [Rhodospirillales bacterium]|nr:hypothetical protein [Rhodospirillales bacterium]MDE0377676.1 hypothetical protein [Rhodospirillales bacterium]